MSFLCVKVMFERYVFKETTQEILFLVHASLYPDITRFKLTCRVRSRLKLYTLTAA
jgi:hypothetical protein